MRALDRIGVLALALFLGLIASACHPRPKVSAFTVEPLPPSQQQPQELMLVRLDRTMGGQVRAITEGAVSFDGSVSFHLKPQAEGAPLVLNGLRRSADGLFVIRVDFTLHRLEEEKRYKNLLVELELQDPRVKVIDFFPRRVASASEVARTITVSPSAPVLKGLRDASGLLPVDNLEPVVTGYRHSARSLSWELEGPAEAPLAAGARSLYLLLQVTPGGRPVPALLRFKALVGTRLFDRWWWPDKTADSRSARFVMDVR